MLVPKFSSAPDAGEVKAPQLVSTLTAPPAVYHSKPPLGSGGNHREHPEALLGAGVQRMPTSGELMLESWLPHRVTPAVSTEGDVPCFYSRVCIDADRLQFSRDCTERATSPWNKHTINSFNVHSFHLAVSQGRPRSRVKA